MLLVACACRISWCLLPVAATGSCASLGAGSVFMSSSSTLTPASIGAGVSSRATRMSAKRILRPGQAGGEGVPSMCSAAHAVKCAGVGGSALPRGQASPTQCTCGPSRDLALRHLFCCCCVRNKVRPVALLLSRRFTVFDQAQRSTAQWLTARRTFKADETS